MIRRVIIAAALVAGAFTLIPAEGTEAARDPEVIVVKMVDISPTQYAFEPADVVAKKGDIVKFVQTVATPHNVEFREGPEGTNLDGDRVGPFLTAPDQVYEVVVDDRFPAGVHNFVCTPHEFMGMVGTLTVQ